MTVIMYTKRDAQYFAVVVVVVSASSSSQRVVRVFFIFFVFTSPRLTPQTERGLFCLRAKMKRNPFLVARISREGEKTSKKPPVTRAYLHLTLVSLEQKTSANVITLA